MSAADADGAAKTRPATARAVVVAVRAAVLDMAVFLRGRRVVAGSMTGSGPRFASRLGGRLLQKSARRRFATT
ncbi:hypothetical protein Skr01_67820 [Sphaerisporangium krabiense]|nr:hypothetical protein Skr01_67820 [Sphaerisporangium krabiense]